MAGRILFTILLPSGSGYFSYKKWYTIYFSGLSRSLGHNCYGIAHQQAGVLCEYPQLYTGGNLKQIGAFHGSGTDCSCRRDRSPD